MKKTMITVSVLAILGAATSTIFDFDFDDDDAISERIETEQQYTAENQFRAVIQYAATQGAENTTQTISDNTSYVRASGFNDPFKAKANAVLHIPITHGYSVRLRLKSLKHRVNLFNFHWQRRMHIFPQMLRHWLTLMSR